MKIQITQPDGSVWEGMLVKEETVPVKWKGYRCLHQSEGGYPNPDNMPIIRPGINAPPVLMSKYIQLVDFRINEFNPLYTGNKWTVAHGYKVAFNNGEGFGDESDIRANFVLNKNTNKPLPKYMKGLICGGGFYTGKETYSVMYIVQSLFKVARNVVQGLMPARFLKSTFNMTAGASVNVLTMTPGIDAANASQPFTDIEAWAKLILSKHWYFHAVTRTGDKIYNFPHGGGQPVYIGYFLKQPVSYPLSWFEKWEEDYLPDPLKTYR